MWSHLPIHQKNKADATLREVFSPYSVRMRENTDQKNSEYGHFSQSESFVKISHFHTNLLLSQWFY